MTELVEQVFVGALRRMAHWPGEHRVIARGVLLGLPERLFEDEVHPAEVRWLRNGAKP